MHYVNKLITHLFTKAQPVIYLNNFYSILIYIPDVLNNACYPLNISNIRGANLQLWKCHVLWYSSMGIISTMQNVI